MKTVYLKPTNYCNVGCDHCYLTLDVRGDKSLMLHSTLRHTAKLVKGLAEAENDKGVHFIWHGGEPMTVPLSWYNNAGAILDEVIGLGGYTESIQTSLIPFSEKWIDLIHERFKSHIGSSMDFSQRTINGSNGKYIDLWLKKVGIARKNGISVTPGIVPSRSEAGREKYIVDFFCENEFVQFNIDRYSNYGIKTIDWPTNREHSEFLINIFDEIISRLISNKFAPMVNVVNAAIRGVAFGAPGDRWGTTCQRDFVVVEPDGSLNSCPDRTSYDRPFSNANEWSKGFIESSERRKWIRIQGVDHKKSHCHSCEFNKWCKSGCPITPNGPSDGQRECSGYKTYLLHVAAALSRPGVLEKAMKYVGATKNA